MPAARPVLLAVALMALASGCGAARPTRIVIRRTERVGASTRCGIRRRSKKDYSWPIKPFEKQHPIRGGFGDPRTISEETLGTDDAGDPGDYSFHNGIDIAAKDGTPVYPVVSGRAHVIDHDAVGVRAGRRVFRYMHIKVLVRSREHVIAGVTELGTVIAPFHHVHFTEIDRERVVNPLLHIRPYVDRTAPEVRAFAFADHTGGRIDGNRLSGDVIVGGEAEDVPPMRVPGVWGGYPLAPALVRSSLTSSSGRVVWRRVAADFMRTEPPQRKFWDVYASGTYQNFPVFDHHYYWGLPGRYVFLLTHGSLDTNQFANGSYTLRATAEDFCGNTGTLSEGVSIEN
ncbi:MAG TPA: hypothetical protein VHV52_10685 [Gaiellaceae bacterium]|nr:hypothetical protein [Gaiellaceae bacterium]